MLLITFDCTNPPITREYGGADLLNNNAVVISFLLNHGGAHLHEGNASEINVTPPINDPRYGSLAHSADVDAICGSDGREIIRYA